MLTSEQAGHESLRLKHDTLMSWRASKNFTPPHLFFFLLLRKFGCNQPFRMGLFMRRNSRELAENITKFTANGCLWGGEVEATVGGHPHDTFLAEEQSWKQTCFGARIPVNLCIRSPNPVDSQQHI